ncbi:redox-sensing transcriptional repressor Rex [Nocardia iowensis]|uniref:Redox-sensing transcriptional repressor Rex n=1 Tax=Nocardia iowensis TaxID=204891 RepID=A0ABX8RNA4_NOCIO|nr:redox-sensing transcriptional repressor Rex [Nocardia iowensis]QXN91078.1 redox-sensing transcriptional repressor Rex [Nocardia iowensis]
MTEQHEAPSGVSGRALQKDIPQATVARLATYLRVLATLTDEGVAIVSSEELAVAAGVNSAKLRKDLSFLGPNGVRGVGYDVARLRARIEDVLGLSQGHRVVLVGAGNLGRALVGYGGFQRRGFTVVGIFDNHPEVIGLPVAGLVVRDVAGLAEAVAALEPTIAVITVPDDAAQDACDRLVAAGLQSILSFAPCELVAPATVEVRRVDLAVELQMLSFERVRNADNASEATTAPAVPEVARPVSSRISHRAPTAHTSAVHQALKHSAAAHTASSHTATEPSSKGSVVRP